MTKTKKQNKKVSSESHTNGVKTRKYTRTTSVGRLLKRFERSRAIAEFATERLAGWASRDASVEPILEQAKAAESKLSKVTADIHKLFEDGWTPPKKSLAIVFEDGEEVEIADKYKEKYLKIYTKTQIKNLQVCRVLDTGEIAIRNGSSTPFLVPKSHLVRRSPDE